ncbi:DNA/RNA polymerase [Alternaria alternata]|uniref:DNA/RNA polymerase n=1 Tax=Alternaria alternata TaxID=5599 RepID=A0A177D6W7_ALTAL|nr:DNA/RNA polymerase [Alternaria alternata]OAG15454.1 DNA/RNA polymerase [Alternaria alternata]
MSLLTKLKLKRQSDSVIVHFDYDCFYASVFEHENPALRSLPLAVQQKQIIVTCNYEARRRGLHKLQLIHQAKKVCPDVVIVLGEDLTRFRNASKQLYTFLRSFSWNSRVERLGFDEVFLDVTDIIDYNISILNHNDLTNAFFCLAKEDPTRGFPYDATRLTGHLYPKAANYDLDTGYTATVGISTNKLLAKLVGNTHKPDAQTTLLPSYTEDGNVGVSVDNVTTFIDDHEVGKIPGIGFKLAQKLRAHVLQRPAEFDAGLVYGGTKESVLVRDVRTFPGMGPESLERLLGGPGVPHGTRSRIWGLLNGCDDKQVGQAREIPRQVSIEDSYMRLDTLEQVTKELRMLARRLLERMHTDLLEEDDDAEDQNTGSYTSRPMKRWLAHPKTLRLSTRPRPPQNPDGSRNRSFARISKSAPMPTFVFNLNAATTTDAIVDKLLTEALLPLFRKLHPEKRGWNLSLVNVAATNMTDAASEKGGIGRDISKMFKRQDEVLKQWRVRGDVMMDDCDGSKREEEEEEHLSQEPWLAEWKRELAEDNAVLQRHGSEDFPTASQDVEATVSDVWEAEDDDDMMDAEDSFRCEECGAVMPMFALGAHYRWHEHM